MDLAMVIMEFKNSDVYARVKLLGDTELKVPTQFVLKVRKSQHQFFLASIWKNHNSLIHQFSIQKFEIRNSRFKFILFHPMKIRHMNNGVLWMGLNLYNEYGLKGGMPMLMQTSVW